MALHGFRRAHITLNNANQRMLETQIAKVGDYNGRELVVQITNGGKIEDQTGTTLKLNWQHENGNQGSNDFVVLDIKTGKFFVYYPKAMLYKGEVNASIEVTLNGQITNSLNFKIIVQGDVFNGEAGTVDGVFISLADVNKKLDDREKEYEELKERQTTVETQFNAIQQDLTDKDIVSAPEIIAARNGEDNLKTRLDKEHQEVTAQLAHIANNVFPFSNELILAVHRGWGNVAPENTLPAFELALKYGFNAVEFDIVATADDDLIVIHDLTVDRTTNGSGNVADMTMEQLRNLEVNYGSNINKYDNLKLPTMDETLSLINQFEGAIPVVNPRNTSTAHNDLLKGYLNKYGYGTQKFCAILIADLSVLEYFKNLKGKYILILSGGLTQSNIDAVKSLGENALLQIPYNQTIDNQIIEYAQELKVRLGMREVDRYYKYKKALEIGIVYALCDSLPTLNEKIERMYFRSEVVNLNNDSVLESSRTANLPSQPSDDFSGNGYYFNSLNEEILLQVLTGTGYFLNRHNNLVFGDLIAIEFDYFVEEGNPPDIVIEEYNTLSNEQRTNVFREYDVSQSYLGKWTTIKLNYYVKNAHFNGNHRVMIGYIGGNRGKSKLRNISVKAHTKKQPSIYTFQKMKRFCVAKTNGSWSVDNSYGVDTGSITQPDSQTLLLTMDNPFDNSKRPVVTTTQFFGGALYSNIQVHNVRNSSMRIKFLNNDGSIQSLSGIPDSVRFFVAAVDGEDTTFSI